MSQTDSLGVSTLLTQQTNTLNIDYRTDIALFVGEFEKGPIEEPIFVSDLLTFKKIFGRSRSWNYNDWYQVYTYMSYNKGMWICRAAGNERIKAYVDGTVANSYGEWGNIMSVFMCTSEEYYNNVNTPLGEIQKIIQQEYVFDYEYIVFVYRDGKQVEQHIVNDVSEIKSSYLETVDFVSGFRQLTNGFVSEAKWTDFKICYDLFDKHSYEIDIIIANEKYNDLAVELAENRKDCIAFVGIPTLYFNTVYANKNILTTEDGLIIYLNKDKLYYEYDEKTKKRINDYIKGFKNSEYCFFLVGFKIIKDGFTGKNITINIASDAAGLKAKASKIKPWGIGAGVENGTILNSISTKLEMSKEDRDSLYKKGVNVLTSDKIMTQKLFVQKSNITKLHQRSLFNYIERNCEKLCRYFVFETNDVNTRGKVAYHLKSILEDMKLSDAIEAGKVHVTHKDETAIIINIYIKIKYMTEFVNLRFTNAGTNTMSEIYTRS